MFSYIRECNIRMDNANGMTEFVRNRILHFFEQRKSLAQGVFLHESLRTHVYTNDWFR